MSTGINFNEWLIWRTVIVYHLSLANFELYRKYNNKIWNDMKRSFVFLSNKPIFFLNVKAKQTKRTNFGEIVNRILYAPTNFVYGVVSPIWTFVRVLKAGKLTVSWENYQATFLNVRLRF